MKTAAELNQDAKIQNYENEIQLLLFHKETLEFKIKCLRKGAGVTSNIAIVQSINAAKDEGLMAGFSEIIEEKDIERRIEYYNTYDELSHVVRRINTMQGELSDFKEHSGRISNQDAMIGDDRIRRMVQTAKNVAPQTKNPLRGELRALIDVHGKGLTTTKQKISFVQALKYALMKTGHSM